MSGEAGFDPEPGSDRQLARDERLSAGVNGALTGANGFRRAMLVNRPATFHIRDGTTLIRVPIDDILAARAADNYVEFMLTDGRRPLMRASLTNVEARLSSTGIVRTHRSWLVNTRHVRSITSTGSGDFRLDVNEDVIVPLSRRYPAVVTSLKVGSSAGR